MTSASLPTFKERGRNTLQRLLDAPERTLESDGLEGATVPAIAARAARSVGNVYKRFKDKDSLLQAVYERFFLDTFVANEFALDPAKWEGAPTAELLSTLWWGLNEG